MSAVVDVITGASVADEDLVATVRAILTWREESPEPGTPECTCSVQACAQLIPATWSEPLRLTDDVTGLVATFCEECELRAFGGKFLEPERVQ